MLRLRSKDVKYTAYISTRKILLWMLHIFMIPVIVCTYNGCGVYNGSMDTTASLLDMKPNNL